MSRSYFKPERPRHAEVRQAIDDAIREAETSPDRYGIHRTDLLWKDRWLDLNIAYVAWELCASRGIIPMDWFVSRIDASPWSGNFGLAPRDFASRSAMWGNVKIHRSSYPYTPIEVLTFASDPQGLVTCEELVRDARHRMGWTAPVRPTWMSTPSASALSRTSLGSFPEQVRDVISARFIQPSPRDGRALHGEQDQLNRQLRDYQSLWNVTAPNPFDPMVKIYGLGYGLFHFSEDDVVLVAVKATKSGRTRT